MIPSVTKRTLISSEQNEQVSFGISKHDQVHIMKILRDQLYSDNILAVLREYASNAWDANRMLGRGDIPIEVNLPTLFSPNLSIKDCGPGLSRHDVYEIYTQYGASTKRDTNEAIGMFGIGSKSAFSYTSSFTITSWHAGTKSIYCASLDDTDAGIIQLLHDEPCGTETGIEIKVPVQANDFNAFKVKANYIFKYFTPEPKLNIPLNEHTPVFKFKNGMIRKSKNGIKTDALGILGCIPYTIDYNELQGQMKPNFILKKADIILCFDIGEVDISANREELRYTDKTRAAIYRRLSLLNDDILAETKIILDRTDITQWERRLLIEEYNIAGISLQHNYSNFLKYITLSGDCYTIKQLNATVSREFQLIIKDDRRCLAGFNVPASIKFNKWRCLAIPMKGVTPAEVYDELLKNIKANNADGIPIKMLSSFTWTKPISTHLNKRSNKHLKKVFAYNSLKNKASNNSDHWNIENILTDDNDVFVDISHFVPIGIPEFHKVFTRDAELAKIAGIPYPKIIGFKNKDKAIVHKGQHYLNWQKKFYDDLLQLQTIKVVLENELLKKHFGHYDAKTSAARINRVITSYVNAGLQQEHRLIKSLLIARDMLNVDISQNRRLIVDALMHRFVSTELTNFNAIMDDYPLLDVDSIFETDDAMIKHQVKYITFCDSLLTAK